jgi:hypothetical protein
MVRSPRRIPSIARAIATVALSALFLIEGIASTVHTATVRHAVCLEHGEVLDVAHGPTHDHPAPSEEGPLVRSGDPHADSHDACAFALLDSPRRHEFHGDLFILGLAEATVVATCEGQPEGRLTVPRILFAPKHSPPA